MYYKTIKKEADAEIVEKKSRFIAHVKPVSSEQEALDMINQLKSKYWNASHNVYAYHIKENNTQRYSDDGEPSGTAGVPVLEVIKKEGLVDTAIVVTRYFGGTLLGAGGLVRAYTKAAKAGIDAGGLLLMQLCDVYQVTLDYDLLGKVQYAILEREAIIHHTEYKENVILEIFVLHEQGFEDALMDAASGRIRIVKIGEKYLPLEG